MVPNAAYVLAFAILYFLCEACEDSFAFRGQYIQLLSLWAEELDILSKHSSRDSPALRSCSLVEQCMHYFNGLVGQFVRLGHACLRQYELHDITRYLIVTVLAQHPDDEPTFCLIWLILEADFTTLNCAFTTSAFASSTLEDRLQCLDLSC